jgi:hypothetical protein
MSADSPHKAPQPTASFSRPPVGPVAVLSLEISLPQGAGPEANAPHKQKALSLIEEFGGRSSGATDNSLRAYFTNGKEALKAAVRIQQYLLQANPDAPAGDQCQGRIGIHFADTQPGGSAIPDMIGMATRLARGAAPSQIFISQPVHDAAGDLHGVHFEPVKILHRAIVWDGPQVYRASWEKNAAYEPGTCIVLYFRPVWAAGDSSFPALWAAVVREDGKTWGDTISKKLILADNCLGLALCDGGSALSIAQNLLKHLRERIEKDPEKPLIPVFTFIHIYDRAGEGGPAIKESDFPTALVRPGDVFVSAEAYKFIRNQSDMPIAQGKEASLPPSWHKVAIDLTHGAEDGGKFLYREALGDGKEEPCFYCGSRRHKAGECPSKHLPDNTHGLEKLGYFSIKEINSLFRKFLSIENSDPQRFCREILEGQNAQQSPALHGFYDLNRVFQLRFFRTLFYVPGNASWGKKMESGAQAKGGQQWLALDSLRVSELVRAESLLKEALAKNPEDYRIYCTLGYLYAEKGDLPEAEYFLKKAIKYTKANTSKIFVHFLLSRLNRLLNRTETSHRNISDVLALDPGCPEALYQEVLFRFREEDERGGLQRLSVLVSDDRKYYIQALIDPDMAPFQGPVTKYLGDLLAKTREAAEVTVRAADDQLAKSTAVLQEKDLREVSSVRSEIQGLVESRSYFGYLDIIGLAETIIRTCNNAVKEQKEEAQGLLDGLNRRAEKDMAFVLDYSFPRLINSYYTQLEHIKGKIRTAKEAPPPASPEDLGACVLVREEIKAELTRIESEFAKLEGWRQVLLNGFKFVKYAIIFLAGVLLAGIFVVPPAVDYLNPLLSRLDFPTITDAGGCQRWFIILGGAASLILSFLITTTRLFKSAPPAKPTKRAKSTKSVKSSRSTKQVKPRKK